MRRGQCRDQEDTEDPEEDRQWPSATQEARTANEGGHFGSTRR